MARKLIDRRFVVFEVEEYIFLADQQHLVLNLSGFPWVPADVVFVARWIKCSVFQGNIVTYQEFVCVVTLLAANFSELK